MLQSRIGAESRFCSNEDFRRRVKKLEELENLRLEVALARRRAHPGPPMNSLERIRCAARGRPVDRTPVAPYIGNYGARVAGVRVGDYCRSGRVMAEAQYRAWQIYGQDVLVAQSDNYYIAEGFGVEVEHYKDSTPTLRKPAVRDLDGVKELQVPDPRSAGRMPVYLEAIGRLVESVDPERWPGRSRSGPEKR